MLDDVLGKKVSAKAARRDEYGVVVDDTGRAVSIGATDNGWQMLREARGPVKWTFDRAPELGRE